MALLLFTEEVKEFYTDGYVIKPGFFTIEKIQSKTSDKPRWSIIYCYNSLSNPAYNDESISWRVPVKIVSDHPLMEAESLEPPMKGIFFK